MRGSFVVAVCYAALTGAGAFCADAAQSTQESEREALEAAIRRYRRAFDAQDLNTCRALLSSEASQERIEGHLREFWSGKSDISSNRLELRIGKRDGNRVRCRLLRSVRFTKQKESLEECETVGDKAKGDTVDVPMPAGQEIPSLNLPSRRLGVGHSGKSKPDLAGCSKPLGGGAAADKICVRDHIEFRYEGDSWKVKDLSIETLPGYGEKLLQDWVKDMDAQVNTQLALAPEKRAIAPDILLFYKALFLLEAGKTVEAEEAAKKAASVRDSGDALYLQALCLEREGSQAEALAMLKASLEKPFVHFSKATAQRKIQRSQLRGEGRRERQ